MVAEERRRGRLHPLMEAVEVVRPVVKFTVTEPRDGPAVTVQFDQLACEQQVVLGTGSDKGQCRRTEGELEEPAAER